MKTLEQAIKQLHDANAKCGSLLSEASGLGLFREDEDLRERVKDALAERERGLDGLLAHVNG